MKQLNSKLSFAARALKKSALLAWLLFASAVCIAQSTSALIKSRDAGPTLFVEQYLAQLQKEKTAIVYAECRLKSGGKVSITIPIASREGLYVERSNHGTVVNTARLIWADARWNTDDAQGGVYTLTRLNALAGELFGSSFQMVLPNKLSETVTARPKRTCVEKLPE
jgi:hypothetical protein